MGIPGGGPADRPPAVLALGGEDPKTKKIFPLLGEVPRRRYLPGGPKGGMAWTNANKPRPIQGDPAWRLVTTLLFSNAKRLGRRFELRGSERRCITTELVASLYPRYI